MDKLYYIEIFKFACLEMQNKEISAKKIFENTISEFNESEFKGQKEMIKDKRYWVKAYNFLIERYVNEVIRPDSEPEAYVEDIKEKIEKKFDEKYKAFER